MRSVIHHSREHVSSAWARWWRAFTWIQWFGGVSQYLWQCSAFHDVCQVLVLKTLLIVRLISYTSNLKPLLLIPKGHFRAIRRLVVIIMLTFRILM